MMMMTRITTRIRYITIRIADNSNGGKKLTAKSVVKNTSIPCPRLTNTHTGWYTSAPLPPPPKKKHQAFWRSKSNFDVHVWEILTGLRNLKRKLLQQFRQNQLIYSWHSSCWRTDIWGRITKQLTVKLWYEMNSEHGPLPSYSANLVKLLSP